MRSLDTATIQQVEHGRRRRGRKTRKTHVRTRGIDNNARIGLAVTCGNGDGRSWGGGGGVRSRRGTKGSRSGVSRDPQMLATVAMSEKPPRWCGLVVVEALMRLPIMRAPAPRLLYLHACAHPSPLPHPYLFPSSHTTRGPMGLWERRDDEDVPGTCADEEQLNRARRKDR